MKNVVNYRRAGQDKTTSIIQITLRSYFPFSKTQVQETQSYIEIQRRIIILVKKLLTGF